ncbi:unannotated protein [freshwater metagenome]|uniref:Unannotated protein n=1 Tax=freshwater metagenome TaxID=449393 RepID=A0A6J6ZQF0_9ZZZZ
MPVVLKNIVSVPTMMRPVAAFSSGNLNKRNAK